MPLMNTASQVGFGAVIASLTGFTLIRDAVLRVTVVPEDRTDIKVDVVKPHPSLPLSIRNDGGRVARYGTWLISINENIDYQPMLSGRAVIESLLIDDGVRDRGHR